MMLRVCLLVMSMGLLVTGVRAQGPPAPTGSVDPAKAVDAMISGVEGDFIGALEAMPAEKYGFAPSDKMFVATEKVEFTGVRTFAQLATHTIQANFLYWGFASGLKPDFDVASLAKMTSKDEIVKAGKASMEFGHRAAATITAANAFEAVRGRPNATRITAMDGGVVHLRDEYGQMVEYLRMNGIKPPASEGKPAANPAK